MTDPVEAQPDRGFFFPLLALAMCGCLIFGCGGPGGGDELLAGGGIGGSGITVGSISAFGSVVVNGVEFDTTAAEVYLEGELIGAGDQVLRDFLKVGMVVRVEGDRRDNENGWASRVFYGDNVEGPVENITLLDAGTGLIEVMGQTVAVDGATRMSGTDLSALTVGSVVEVSGFADQNGAIRATYLEKKSDVLLPGAQVEVKGIAQAVDAVLKKLQVNQLTVDYSAADTTGVESEGPFSGQLLEIKGSLVAGVLIAARVESIDELGSEDAAEVEVQGIVTEFASLSDFVLNSVPVATDAVTRFKGLLPEDVAAGSSLIVSGSLNDGILLADTIRPVEAVRLEADAVFVDPLSGTISLSGLEAIRVEADALTRYVGAARELDQILPGSHLRVFGQVQPGNSVRATKVIVNSASKDKIALKGPVETIFEPVVRILGIDVDTALIPEDGFETSEGEVVGRSSFFNAVAVGDLVNAKGILDGGAVEWNAAELDLP